MIKKRNGSARCEHCDNNYTSEQNYCPSCGHLKSETTTFRLIYTVFFIGLSVLGIPWLLDTINSASQNDTWGRAIIMIIIITVPLFLMLMGMLYFLMEFLTTLELKATPDKLIHSNPEVRREAVNLIGDESLLMEIAKTDSHPTVRIAALNKISEPYLISDIAQNDRSIEVRIAAINKIDSDAVLQTIAMETKEPKVKEAAISRINDQKILIELARKEVSEDLDALLFQRIKNPAVVQDLKQRYPERLLYKLIDELSLGIDIKHLKDILAKVSRYKEREWVEMGLLTLMDKVRQLPKNIVKMYITLSAIETLGTLNNNKMIESIYQQIIQEHQRSFNNYIEMKQNPLDQFPPDSHDLIRILYTGIDLPFNDE